MPRARRLLPLLAACLLLAASARAAGPSQSLVLKPGQVFKITLAANHTTGYKWVLADVPDAKVIKMVTTNYVHDQRKGPDGKPLVGAGGQEVWTFQAVGQGRATIVLHYLRPWEKKAKPAKTRSLEVEVR